MRTEDIQKNLGAKAQEMYHAAEEAFSDYWDPLVTDMMFNYSDLLKFCDEELLEMFDVSYDTEVEPNSEDERHSIVGSDSDSDEPEYAYEYPAIIWTPKKGRALSTLIIDCSGYRFEDGRAIECVVNADNEKEARLCAKWLRVSTEGTGECLAPM